MTVQNNSVKPEPKIVSALKAKNGKQKREGWGRGG